MDQKREVARLVRLIDELRARSSQHWTMAQRSIECGNVDDAISLLNAHFGQKTQLERAEADLIGLLKAYFADK